MIILKPLQNDYQILDKSKILVQIVDLSSYSMKKDKYYIYNEKKVEKGILLIQLIKFI